MKSFLSLLFSALLLSSCGSSEEAASAIIKLGKDSVLLKLHYVSFFNPDGLEKRKVTIEYPNSELHDFNVHVAHYSNVIQLKKVDTPSGTYLIAEDNTGYTVWDLDKKRVIAEDGMDDNKLVDEPEGNGRDYMTHTALSQAQWANILSVKPISKINITTISLQ